MKEPLPAGLIDPLDFKSASFFRPSTLIKRAYISLFVAFLSIGAISFFLNGLVDITVVFLIVGALLIPMFWMQGTGWYLIVPKNICVIAYGELDGQCVTLRPEPVAAGTLIRRRDPFEGRYTYLQYAGGPPYELTDRYYHYGATSMTVTITPSIAVVPQVRKPSLVNQLRFSIELEIFGTPQKFLSFWYHPNKPGVRAEDISQIVADDALEIIAKSPAAYNYNAVSRGVEMANTLTNALRAKTNLYGINVSSIKVTNNHQLAAA